MSDVPKMSAEIMKCPLCEGRGELEKRILLERLQEKDLARKLQTYFSNIVAAEQSEELHGLPLDQAAKHNVENWNLTHFLWRRSPKE